jgi:LysR family transcriptional regulator, glycine cleavage system transcriptional activator
MISSNLPPLRALRVFDVVARNLNFSRAADELRVTEPAVSQQIRALEEHFGKKLFLRAPQGVQLTVEGKILHSGISSAFESIRHACGNVLGHSPRKTLRVHIAPHLAARWLLPRLHRFMANYPEIDLQIQHEYEHPVKVRPDIDLAIAWRHTDFPGTVCEPLMRLKYLPMCSPHLLSEIGGLRSPRDLASFTLLQERGTSTWAEWFAAANAQMPNFKRTIVFDNYDVTVQAAVQGQGVAILMFPTFSNLLDRGELVAPFGVSIHVPITCYLLHRAGALMRQEALDFRNWLFEEAADDLELLDLHRLEEAEAPAGQHYCHRQQSSERKVQVVEA